MSEEANFWIMDEPPDTDAAVNPEWVALVSEKAGGIVAIGRRDVLVSLADLLQTFEEA